MQCKQERLFRFKTNRYRFQSELPFNYKTNGKLDDLSMLVGGGTLLISRCPVSTRRKYLSRHLQVMFVGISSYVFKYGFYWKVLDEVFRNCFIWGQNGFNDYPHRKWDDDAFTDFCIHMQLVLFFSEAENAEKTRVDNFISLRFHLRSIAPTESVILQLAFQL